MASTGVFGLTRFTALASGDVLPGVDVSNTSQNAHGSLLAITAANFFASAQPITVAAGTVTVSTPVFQATETWNDGAVTFTAIDLNVTSTASAAASLLVNLRVGGTSQWKVTKAGAVTQTGALAIAGALSGVTTFAASGVVTLTDATDSTTPTTGAVLTAGGVGIAKALFGGTTINAGTGLTFTTSVKSTTALATPSALAATQFTGFASTVYGAAVMGYGTTYDATLFNRAGTAVLGVGPNTALVTLAGALTAAGTVLTTSDVQAGNQYYINTGASDKRWLFDAGNLGGTGVLWIVPSTTNNGSTFTTPVIKLTAGGGLQVGAPTGGDKGAGAVNIAGDIYKNNTAYTNPDYVFEALFTGNIVHNINKLGAHQFLDNWNKRGGRLMTIDEVRNHARRKLRLPGVADAMGAFERADVALTQLEIAHAYIWELHDRVTALEAM